VEKSIIAHVNQWTHDLNFADFVHMEWMQARVWPRNSNACIRADGPSRGLLCRWHVVHARCPARNKSSGDSSHYGLPRGDSGYLTFSAAPAIPMCSATLANKDPVMDSMAAPSWCSSCKLMRPFNNLQILNTEPAAVQSEGDGGTYDEIAT